MEEGLGEWNRGMVNGMMLMEIEVGLGMDGEVDDGVVGYVVEDVAEERKRGRDVGFG